MPPLGLKQFTRLPDVKRLRRLTLSTGGGGPSGPYVYDFVADTGPSGTSTAGLGGSTPRRTVSGLTVQPLSGLRSLSVSGVPRDINSWGVTQFSTLATGQADSEGLTTAIKVTEDTSTNNHAIKTSTITNQSAGTFEYSVDIKPAGRNFAFVQLAASNTGNTSVFFGLTGAGSVGAGATTSPATSASILALPNGFYRCTVLLNFGGGGAVVALVGPALGLTSADQTYAGDGASGIIVKGLSIQEDVVALPIPADSAGTATITFDDNSTQTVANLQPGTWWKLDGLTRPLIKSISLPRGVPTLNYGPIAVGFAGEFPRTQNTETTPFLGASQGQVFVNPFPAWVGAGGADFIRVHWSNVLQGTDREYDSSTAVPIEIDLADPSTGKVVRATFSGQKRGLMPAGAVDYYSDPIYPQAFGAGSKFPANKLYVGRVARSAVSGTIDIAMTRGTTVYATAPADISFYGTANIIGSTYGTGSIGTSLNQVYLPTLISGRTSTAVPAVFMSSDSIGRGQNDALNPDGAGGWFDRGLYGYDGNGGLLPSMRASRDSSSPVSAITGADSVVGSAKKFALTKYFTHFISNHAHNGFTTAVNLLSINKQAWALAKNTTGSKVKRVEHILALPETQGSSSFTSDAGQTFNTSYQFLLDWNALLLTTVGTQNLDAVIDLNTGYVMSSTKANVFSSVGGAFTPEGTHLTALGSASAAIPWKARAASYMLPAP